jgi:hypothetical protein
LFKKISRKIALIVVPFLGSWFIRLIYALNKKNFHMPSLPENEPIIYACWHGELFMFAHSYLYHKKKPHAKALVSSHFDGDLIAKTLQRLQFEIIHGSSNRNPARALLQAIKAIKEGYDLGITPDGPKGPRHKVADGIIMMAQKTGAKVVLISIKSSKFWQLNSWDKFVIPKPFGEINFYFSQPLDITEMEAEDARDLIQKGLSFYEH